MTLLLAIVSLAVAADRVILVLPVSESRSAWSAAANLAGLAITGPADGPRVELRDHGDSWSLTARDREGAEKSLQIVPPRTASDREDTVWLALSLLAALPHPPDLGSAPVRLRLPPAPVKVSAAPARVERAPASPILETPKPIPPLPPPAVAALTAPSTPALASPPPNPEPEDSRPAIRAWARVGPVLAARAETSPSPGLELTAGVALGDALWLGVGGTWLSSRALPETVETARMSATDLGLAAWWSPPRRLAPLLGLNAGLSARAYAQDGEVLTHFLVPRLSAELGGVLALTDALSLVGGLRLGADIATTFLVLPDGTVQKLSPVQGEGLLLLRARIP